MLKPKALMLIFLTFNIKNAEITHNNILIISNIKFHKS